MLNKGISDAVRDVLLNSTRQFWTTREIVEKIQNTNPEFTSKQIQNAWHRTMLSSGLVEDTGELKGKSHLYKVVEEKREKFAGGKLVDAEFESAEISPATEAKEALTPKDLERRIGQLKAHIAELENTEAITEINIGRCIARALLDKTAKINQLEAQLRENDAKYRKIRSEDRGMIGNLQRRIKSLEDELATVRGKLKQHEGITVGGKPLNLKGLM